MTVVFHPEFPEDIKRFEMQYRSISDALASRFRAEIEEGIEQIKSRPTAAGHFLNTGSEIVKEVRRRNLTRFPFFLLYAIHEDTLIFRSVIPSESDPLTWLPDFETD